VLTVLNWLLGVKAAGRTSASDFKKVLNPGEFQNRHGQDYVPSLTSGYGNPQANR
jgi:hypothetical protein